MSQKNRKVFIYILIDPRSGDVKYVGRTHKIEPRMRQHHNIFEPKTKKERWIASLKKEGLEAEYEVVHVTDELEWEFWEIHFISLFKSFGYDLTNATDGGSGFYNTSEETKEKYRQNMLNAPQIHRNRISKKVRGRKYSEDHLAKLKEAHKGHKNEKLKRSIVQLNEQFGYIRNWESVSDACRGLGKDPNCGGTIATSIRRKSKAYGYRWEYKDVFFGKALLNAVSLAVPL